MSLTGPNKAPQQQDRPTSGDFLPPDLKRARQLKSAGLAASVGVLAVGATAAALSGLIHPVIPQWLPKLAIAVPTSSGLALAIAKAILGDTLGVEWHKGRLHIDMVHRNGQFVSSTSIEVRALVKICLYPHSCVSLNPECLISKADC